MNTRKLLVVCAVTFLVVSLPFILIHLLANPDDAPITPLQHVVAAFANFLGPWGVAIVRVVDFPNAGMREFNWFLSAGLTIVGMVLMGSLLKLRARPLQFLFLGAWAVFSVVWFGIGLQQIASGLL